MRGSFEHCLAAISERGSIGKKEALDIIEEVAERAEEMKRTGASDPFVSAAFALAQELKEKTAQARIDALRNATARAGIETRALSEAEGRVAPGVSANLIPTHKLTLADGLRSLLHYMPGASRHDNVESMWVGLERQLTSPIGNKLRQEGLERAALDDALRHEVAEGMWRLNGGAPDATVTVSSNAQKMAEAFLAPLNLVRDRMNALGARIGDALDYVTHTNWNPRQLRAAAGPGADREASYQAWKARDVPRMADKTFDGITPREGETAEDAKERFIRSLYDATESGVHMRGVSLGSFTEDNGYIPPIYEGTHNIARSASQQRVVYWKTAKDWADHQSEFGGGQSLYHDVYRTLSSGARRISLMNYLGTNPEANFETVVKRLRERNRTSDELSRFDNQIQGVRNVLGRLTGALNVPLHDDAGQITNYLMSLEATMHLGGVSITHLSAAPATFSSELAHHGVGRMESLANIVRALATNRGGQIEQDALADAGAYAHGYALGLQRAGTGGDAYRRDGVPGFVSWLSSNFMRFTGLPQILDMLQAKATKSVLMDRLGRQAHLPLDQIEEHQRAALRAYGVEAADWDLVRNASDQIKVEGRRWIVPSDALNSDPAQVEALLRTRGVIGENADAATVANKVQQYQWGLGDKLLMYLNDAGDRGAVRPGVRERAIILRGNRPGDPYYFLSRAVAQFKMWPLAAVNQILGRDIAQSLSNKEMITNLGALIAFSTLGGAMRMSINDVASGRPQRDYTNPVTLLAGLAQGGGLGIYGDFLFGETSRMSTGLVSTLGGPLAGDGERFYNLYARFKADLKDHPDKAMQHMWPDLAHMAVQHVPFANLIYIKGALDYLTWYHLFEAASPGWWERTNRRVQKEQGRTFSGYTPGRGVPGGIPGLYGAGWNGVTPLY